jgi:L-fucose isomerase-like protein
VTTFRYQEVASPLHDAATVRSITGALRARLGALDGRPGPPDVDPDVPFLVVVATGGTEQAILETARGRARARPHEPVVLVAHPRHNSLPAALEALARLHQDGHRGRIAYVPDGEADEPADAVADLAAWHLLHASRLGQVGDPSDWLVASTPEADRVRRRWGVELVTVPMDEVLGDHRPPAAGAVPVRWPGHEAGPAPAEVVAAEALHPTLTAVLERHRVDALTVRCFDFLGELRTSGCLALADLNEAGIVAGCEGDVASAVAMLWIRHLLDSPSWIANPAQVDVAAGELVLAHCTIAPSLAEDLHLDTHFESGLGVGISGTIPPGPVTLVRLGGTGLERRWLADGEVVGSGDSPDLCRTQATVRLEPGRVVELLDGPLGNHLVLVPGHHRERLDRWWRLAVADAGSAAPAAEGGSGRAAG